MSRKVSEIIDEVVEAAKAKHTGVFSQRVFASKRIDELKDEIEQLISDAHNDGYDKALANHGIEGEGV